MINEITSFEIPKKKENLIESWNEKWQKIVFWDVSLSLKYKTIKLPATSKLPARRIILIEYQERDKKAKFC